MSKIIVDDLEVDVPPEYTLLQACEAAGVEVPRFCYHERLSIAGNCRMCLVEVKGGPPKPTASCAMSVRDLRPGPNGEPPVVLTKSPMVKKAREGVMEFLLINHPLDCPICDQGGECDLQDQAMAYGVDSSRFAENKRAVEDKYIGPLVRTSMNRCIHCTRCVRFTAEVAGTGDMGAVNRGEDTEITTYLASAMGSEMQGNVADLCPVGALLHKPGSNRARPWEYRKTPSVDVMDAMGSAIRVDARGREVMRILPRLNDAINEEWIGDKTRHVVDGLRTQRLDRPYVRVDGKLKAASWGEAFAAIAAKLKGVPPEKIGALAGQLTSAEEGFALKSLVESLGSKNLDCRYPGSPLHPKNGRASYLFNSTIAGVEQADSLVVIGSNPRKEAPVLNSRIRRRWLKGGFKASNIGAAHELTYPVAQLGAGADTLSRLTTDTKEPVGKTPMVIVGQGALNRDDGASVYAGAIKLAQALGALGEGWNGFNVMHTEAGLVGLLDIGFVPGEGGKSTGEMLQSGALDVLFNLGADEIDVAAGPFVVYIGTHGDRGAHRADVILPGAAYTEKSATYVNMEGRPQMTERASFPPGDAREDWAILRALSDAVGHKLPFDTLQALRSKLYASAPHLAGIDVIATADASGLAGLGDGGGEASGAPFVDAVTDYYLTNPIARASATMAECSALARGVQRQAAE